MALSNVFLCRLIVSLFFAVLFSTGSSHAGIITGTVTAETNGQALEGVMVDIVSGDPCDWWEPVMTVHTNESGVYTSEELDGGDYHVRVDTMGQQPYITEWRLDDISSSPDCSQSNMAHVNESGSTSSDFQLDSALVVSGTVQNDSGAALENVCVDASSHACWSESTIRYGGGVTESDGSYVFFIPETADPIYISTSVRCGASNGVDEYWTANGGVPLSNCGNAENAYSTIQNSVPVNFQLTPGIIIEGTVTSGNDSDPVSGICIDVLSDACGFGQWNGQTDENGNYSLIVPNDGNPYFLQTIIGCSPNTLDLIDAYWQSGTGGSTDCNDADSVPSSGVTSYDFHLEESAVISGTVTDGSTAIENLQITVYDDKCNGNYVGETYTDVQGNYSIPVVPGLTYYLQTCVSCDSHPVAYIDEYWDDTTDCRLAEGVTSTLANPATGIDFELEVGVEISGTIYESDGTTPLEGVYNIGISLLSGTCGDYYTVTDGHINLDGTYSFTTGHTGTFFIRTESYGDSNFMAEFWNTPNSTPDCNQAATISITDDGNGVLSLSPTGEKDFQLDPGGQISGSLVDSSNGDSPITNTDVRINVFSSENPPCDFNNWVGGTNVNADGTYTVSGLADGTYYVGTDTYMTPYISEWYAGTNSSHDCMDAQVVSVTVEVDNQGNNFQLEPGGQISGILRGEDGNPLLNMDIYINAFAIENSSCDWNEWVAGTRVNADGSYTVLGLPEGDYYLLTDTGSTAYINEWSSGDSSTSVCGDAVPVHATPDIETPNKNFQLGLGVIFHGTIYHTDGVTPLTDHNDINVNLYSGTCNNFQYVSSSGIDSFDGTYSFTIGQTGTFLIRAGSYSNADSNFAREFWSTSQSNRECMESSLISIESDGNGGLIMSPSGAKDFQLGLGGKLSGILYAEGGGVITNTNIQVNAYITDQSVCNDHSYINGSNINSDGTYSINGLAPGDDYYLRIRSNNTGYVEEWYAGASSSVNCADAQTVTVTADENNGGKDFQIALGGSVTGTLYDEGTSAALIGKTNLQVKAYSVDPCTHSDSVARGNVDSGTGIFTINGLEPGVNYYFRNDYYGESRYVREWHMGNNTSSTDCTDAQVAAIQVLSGETTSGVDFNLAEGVYISGTLFNEDGTTPFSRDGEFGLIVFQGDSCETGQMVAYGDYNPVTGYYKTDPVEAGNYYLRTWGEEDDAPVEWWKSPRSVASCPETSFFTVTPADITNFVDITGKDFQLHEKMNNITPILMLLLF